jgi:hypothetical protein
VNDKYRQKLIDLVQPSIGEPVLAVALLQPEGSWRASSASFLFGGAVGAGMRHDADRRAGGLAANGVVTLKMALLAVTEHELHVFDVKSKMSFWKLLGEVAAWRREDVRFEVNGSGMSTAALIEVVPTGEAYELEATMVGTLKPINQQFFDTVASAPVT